MILLITVSIACSFSSTTTFPKQSWTNFQWILVISTWPPFNFTNKVLISDLSCLIKEQIHSRPKLCRSLRRNRLWFASSIWNKGLRPSSTSWSYKVTKLIHLHQARVTHQQYKKIRLHTLCFILLDKSRHLTSIVSFSKPHSNCKADNILLVRSVALTWRPLMRFLQTRMSPAVAAVSNVREKHSARRTTTYHCPVTSTPGSFALILFWFDLTQWC